MTQETSKKVLIIGAGPAGLSAARVLSESGYSVEIFDMNTLATQNLSKQKFDLITSNASLQWLDLKQVLPTLANMLNKKGILLLSTFAKQNLKKIQKIIKNY